MKYSFHKLHERVQQYKFTVFEQALTESQGFGFERLAWILPAWPLSLLSRCCSEHWLPWDTKEQSISLSQKDRL